MGMAVSETPRHKLRQYSAGTDPHPTRATFNGEVAKLELLPAIIQGSTGDRPLSGTGKVLYWDEAVKRFVYDDGTEWQDVAPIGGVTPTGVAVAGAASEGTSPRAARADHTHPLPLATAVAPGAMPAADKAKLDAGTSAATASTVMSRDASGRTQVATPSVGADATPKSYVDSGLAGKSATGHSHTNATTSAPGFMSASDKSKLDIIPTISAWQPLAVFGDHSASAYTPEYRTNSGRVELRGAVIRGNTNTGFTGALPANLQPLRAFAVALTHTAVLDSPSSSGTVFYGAVGNQGNVYPGFNIFSSIPAGSFVFLDGISWATGS